ncbi:MAG: hypothetical protein NTY23_04265 [Chloroflexi bacterium]|nr:hypothetical protein [Chloroflexota bacterium]
MREAGKEMEHHARSGGRAWFFLTAGIGLMVVAVAGMFLAVRARNAGAPQASVDREVIDLGNHPYGERVRAEFKLTNTGGGTLEFAAAPEVEVVEGC